MGALVTALTGLALISGTVLSQGACAQAVQASFERIGSLCEGAEGGTACADTGVTLTDFAGTASRLTAPANAFSLDEVARISVEQPAEGDMLGAALNVYANVPLGLSQAGLRYFLIGNVALENLVDPESAVLPAEAIVISPIVGANLRVSPSADARVLASAAAGTELQANGVSRDQQWLRVLHEGQRVWISRQTVAERVGEIEALPIVSNDDRTLMQSFKLTTADRAWTCAGLLPDMLFIQGPTSYSASITANGTDIRFTSTVVLRLDSGLLRVYVLDGSATLGSVTVPAGFTIQAALGPDGTVAAPWTALRAITDEERNFLTALEILPVNALYSAVKVPSQAQINEILAAINASSTSQTIAGPAQGRANCRAFRPTSPLSGMPNGESVPFYWDGAPGATAYRLNFYDTAGVRVRSFEVSALSTTFSVNTTSAALGAGSSFGWDVDALVDGQVACTTGRVSVVRDFADVPVSSNQQPQPQAQPTACIWGSC
jgi:hypothetical protein